MKKLDSDQSFFKLHKGEIIYWCIPLVLFGIILALGLEDDPTMSGSQEVIQTLISVAVVGIVLFVLFIIPFMIYKRRPKSKKRTEYVVVDVSPIVDEPTATNPATISVEPAKYQVHGFMKVLRWIVMIVGVIELLPKAWSLAAGDTSNSIIYPFIFWIVLVFIAGYFEFRSNKKGSKTEYVAVNDKHPHENSEQLVAEHPVDNVPKTKRGLWSTIGSVLVFLLIFGVSNAIPHALFRNNNTGSTNQSLAELTSQSAQEIKSSFELPYEIDEVTTLSDVRAVGSTLQYYYIIHDADTSNLSVDSLRSSILPNVCSSEDSKKALDIGINVQYNYTVKETNLQLSFTIAKSNC